MFIAPLRPKTQRRLKDRELNQARSKPDTVKRPVRTARIFVHHYSSTQYCNTETVFIYIPRLNVRVHSSKVELAAAGVHPVGMISSHASI